jgi:replicative DNA helicase
MADKIDERMSGALQENVLTLLCFDTDAAKVIRSVVEARMFESRVYQDFASHAITFLDQYGEAIGEHLPDVVEDALKGDDKKKATLYKRTLDNLNGARQGINTKFVISKLHEFAHQQTLKSSILKAVEEIEAGHIDRAELALHAGLKSQVHSFDIGTSFIDGAKSLAFFDKQEEGLPLGIKALDDAGIMPAPGTMMLMIAPAKKGKSWFLVHGARYALLQRKKVLVVTLEMSEALYSQRFVQSLFSMTKRQALVKVPRIVRGTEQGAFMGIEFDEVTRPTFADAGARKAVEKQIKQRFKGADSLIIKAFPMASLTIQGFEAYLDSLERLHRFVPDVVCFDYPDLMKVDTESLRMELGAVFKEHRGLAVRRNYALLTATQGNRESAKARVTMDTHVAEDYSKIATADIVLTYSQTNEEKRLGLARLFVSNARTEEDKFTVLITQQYQIGQFAMDSMKMGGDYWDRVDEAAAAGRRQAA